MYENFPYTNMHNLNLDWFLNQFKEIKDRFDSQLNDTLIALINKYFDRIMIDSIYNHDIMQIELKKNICPEGGSING